MIGLLIFLPMISIFFFFFFFSSRRRHTRFDCDWSSDVCSSDLTLTESRLVVVMSLPEFLIHAQGRRFQRAALGGAGERQPVAPGLELLPRLPNLVAEHEPHVPSRGYIVRWLSPTDGSHVFHHRMG